LVPAVLVLLMLAPWALRTRAKGLSWQALCAVVAVLLFVALRLPSGNVWDAVLDPWLWLALHVFGVRALIRR
jgi:beta-lactamase regulating signal transducer with metallopeptidase domain